MSYNPNVLYDTGVLAAATQTITVPSVTMNGVTSCRIKIDHVNTNATTETEYLYVNSDTNDANYKRGYLIGFGNGTTDTGNSTSPIIGSAYASNKSMSTADVSVVGGVMFFTATTNRLNTGSGLLEIASWVTIKQTGTVTDLQGMTLQTTNANGWGIGSRVIVYKN
jgi:hypothetical protein